MHQPLLIGTSGYSYPGPPPKGWFGAFYPQPKPKRFDELKYYSQIFNTVEINSTFYRPPSLTTTTAWATKTPADFTFSVKLWQKFTHPLKIGRKKSADQWEPPTQEDIDQFRAGMAAAPRRGGGQRIMGALRLPVLPRRNQADRGANHRAIATQITSKAGIRDKYDPSTHVCHGGATLLSLPRNSPMGASCST
jgi:hypothetical protein